MNKIECDVIKTALNTTLSMLDIDRNTISEARSIIMKSLTNTVDKDFMNIEKPHDESLLKVQRMMLLHISELGIPHLDKTEIATNLKLFLDPENYDETIQVLKDHYDNKKVLK